MTAEAPAAAAREVVAPRRLRGTIAIPGDKSVTHRALLFNALAAGDARVHGGLDAADTRSTLAAVRALGVGVSPGAAGGGAGEAPDLASTDLAAPDRAVGGTLVVHGRGRGGLHEPGDVIDCGNSGTTIRLLAGVLAGCRFLSVLTGDASLRERPMGRVLEPLGRLGADVTGRAAGTRPPLVIRGGTLRGGQQIELPVASAQVKSAILLAALAADGPVTVVEPSRSRDHTERMLAAMGARVAVDGPAVTLSPGTGDLAPVDVRVPGDISTAAAWIVAATLHPDADVLLTNVGVNPTRTGLLDILRQMGADITVAEERLAGGEPVADLRVRSAALRGVEVGGDLVPRAIDELPLVALCGAVASGRTVIRDASEMRVKETDRIETTAAALRALGAAPRTREDGLEIEGGRLLGGTVDSAGDHRLAMLGAVAGLLTPDPVVVTNADVVDVSYPDFWHEVGRLGAYRGQVQGSITDDRTDPRGI